MKLKYSIFFLIIIGFIAILIFDDYTLVKDNSDKFFKKKDSINLKVYKVSINHGIVEVNNLKFFPHLTILKSEKPSWIYKNSKRIYVSDINPPFLIQKEKNTTQFYVIKKSDTLIFELPDVE